MATNKKPYIKKQLQERLLEALETERAGIKIYEAALVCAINMNLRSEWGEYLKQTRSHEHVLLTVFEEMGLDPDTKNLCRDEVTRIGDSLVSIMLMAKANGTAETAQLVAGECVVLAETKNNQNWELIGHLAEHGKGQETNALKIAFRLVEQAEERHLYHTKSFVRELWVESFSFPAVLPPSVEMLRAS